MTRQQRDISRFFSRVECRIAQEARIAATPGARETARTAAAHRAHQLALDLDYLRGTYAAKSGEGHAK